MYSLYLTSLLVTFFSSVTLNRSFQFLLLILVTLVSISFFGLRWHSGADYAGYLMIYEYIPTLSSFSLSAVKDIHGELGFLFFSSFVKSLGTADYFYMFILSVISISLKSHFFFKESPLPVLSFSIYLLFLGMTFEFVQIRYALSITFIMLSISSLVKGDRYKSFLLFCLGVAFHYFSVIFVVMYFYRRIKVSLVALYFMSLFTFLVISNLGGALFLFDLIPSFVSETILGRRVMGYIDTDEHYSQSVAMTSFLFLRVFLFAGIILFFHKRFNLENDKFHDFFRICMLFLFIFSFLSFNSIMFSRAVALVEILNFLLIAFCIEKSKKVIDRFLILSVFFVFSCLSFLKALDSENIYSYQTWLSIVF
ncbi:EpsG family protein [Pseudoalteromonas sp. BZB3]|uniref:EpsG family protein n=1 Tax=Pseudoalteromonas sp. BZB3 TaxID=3136670 RepID=UPI0032C4600B